MKRTEQNNQAPIRNMGRLYARGRQMIVSTLAGVEAPEIIPSDAINGECWQPELRKDVWAWRLLAGLAEALHRAALDGLHPQLMGKHKLRILPGRALYLIVPREPIPAAQLQQDRWFARIHAPEQQMHPDMMVTAAQTSYAFAALLVSIIGTWPGGELAVGCGNLREDLSVNPFTGSIPALELLSDGLPCRQALQGLLYQALTAEPHERPGMQEWHALLMRCATAVEARAAMIPPVLPPEATLVTDSGQYGVMLADDPPAFACRYRAVPLAEETTASWDSRLDMLSRQQRRKFKLLQFPVDMVRSEGHTWLLYEQCCPGPVLPRQEEAEYVPEGEHGRLLTLLRDLKLARSLGLYITGLPSLSDAIVIPSQLGACDDGCAAVIRQLVASMAKDGAQPAWLRYMAQQHAHRPIPLDEWISALQTVR